MSHIVQNNTNPSIEKALWQNNCTNTRNRLAVEHFTFSIFNNSHVIIKFVLNDIADNNLLVYSYYVGVSTQFQ